jgi:hypothetical protein
MPDKGGTYTIVVDKNGNIVSATYNGVMMTDRPERVIGPHPKDHDGSGEDVNLTLPSDLSGCICLGQFFNDQESDQQCRIIWGKLV